MRKILIVVLTLGFVACAQNKSDKPKTLAGQVETFIEADEYEKALKLLETEDESDEVLKLMETTHLNYGLFLEYRDSNNQNMREKMNAALEQYIEVLKINHANQKAVSEIQQILSIYNSFPDRAPDGNIVEELKSLGFDF